MQLINKNCPPDKKEYLNLRLTVSSQHDEIRVLNNSIYQISTRSLEQNLGQEEIRELMLIINQLSELVCKKHDYIDDGISKD